MKKFLSIILAILMIVTMLPMAVMPASAAYEYDETTKLSFEIINLVREWNGERDELNTSGSAFYDESLTKLADGEYKYTYRAALGASGGTGTWWSDTKTVTFDGVNCESDYYKTFEFTESAPVGGHTMTWTYTLQIKRYKGHTYGDCSDNGDGTHTRICSTCGEEETKYHNFVGADCKTKGKCVCGLESEKNSNVHVNPIKYVVNSENNLKHYGVYECCGVVTGNLDHKYDAEGMCKDCEYQCEHTSYTNGICDTCSYKCTHTAIADGECTLCGKTGVHYINRYWDEETKSLVEVTEMASVEIIEIDRSLQILSDGCWYVARGNISKSYLQVSGTAHLILADGATLNLLNGLRVDEGNTIYIYAQSSSDNCGKLIAEGGYYDRAGIGGSDIGKSAGTIVINGGDIKATAGRRGPAIGAAFSLDGKTTKATIVINGGVIDATSASYYSAAIGDYNSTSGCSITINGGTINTTKGIIGSYYGAGGDITINGGNITTSGIGSVSNSSGNITINGGNVTATGIAGIGGESVDSIVINGGVIDAQKGIGSSGDLKGNITINGGVISANSSSNTSAAIGGGQRGTGGSINISGGEITVNGGEYAAAIGGGHSGSVDSITINGGTITANGGENAAAIGGGYKSSVDSITINGGTITANEGYTGIGAGNSYETLGAVIFTGGNIKAKGVLGESVTDGNGNDVTLNTITLSGATADTPVTKIEGIKYGINDVKTLDTDKLYFYLPADSVASSITAGGNKYICNIGLTYYTAHDWSNKDGICANGCGYECPHESYTDSVCDTCGYVCPHESYTDGVCDDCSYECPHEWGEGVLTRPVHDTVLGSKDGYYTYTCTVCDYEKKETVKGADYSAYEAVSEEINALLQSDELTDAAKQEIYSAANECGLLSDELMESEQNIVDDLVAELEKIIADADEKIASGEYVKADYTEIDQAIHRIKEKFLYEDVTDEGKAELEEIKKQLEEMKADENTSKADLAELEKELEAYEEELDKGIENGTLVSVRPEKISTKFSDNWNEKLEAEGLLDERDDFINNQKFTDEALAAVDEIENFLYSLEGTVAENAENLAKLNEMFNSVSASWENCLRGTHNFGDYEVTSPAKCGENAVETRTCWFCGETDEREVEGSALEHIFLDYVSNGDATCTADGTKTAFCIHGCGATDTVADEDTMLDHTDEDGDKICDDCHDEIKDVCPDCGRAVHEESGIAQYICAIIMFVKLVVSFVKMLQGAAA